MVLRERAGEKTAVRSSHLLLVIALLIFIGTSLVQATEGILEGSIAQVLISGQRVWIGGPLGLALSRNLGTDWDLVYPIGGSQQLTALAGVGDTVLLGLGYSVEYYGNAQPTGLGMRISTDGGATFTDCTPARGQTTSAYELPYSLAITPGRLWAACFWGGLLVSQDNGLTWYNHLMDGTVDTVDTGLSQDHPERLMYSLTADDQPNPWLWAGSLSGIWRSTDNGATWIYANRLTSGLTGDQCVAMNVQHYGDRRILWAATKPVTGTSGHSSISRFEYQEGKWITSENNEAWLNTRYDTLFSQPQLNVWGIDFQDSIIYLAATEGLFRSVNWGHSWERLTIQNLQSGNRSLVKRVTRVACGLGGLWAGTEDGLWLSSDGGRDWRQLGVRTPTEELADDHACLVYPSPFRPGSDPGGCKIAFSAHYGGTVSIRVYDDALEPVRTLVTDDPAPREALGEYARYWDGTDDRGRKVDNGVYHVQVKFSSGEECWTAVGVIR